jgi:lipopolysaccharide export system permease protein
MNRVDRYITRATVAPFFFGTATVIFIFLMQFLMKALDKLVGKGLDNFVIIQLISYNIAWMVILAVPMGVLFASLIAFGNLSANHEITVLKASGGSLIRMMLPLLIVATFLSYGLFLYNNYVVPETNHRVVMLMYDIQRKKPTFTIEPGQFSDAIDGYIILAREIDTVDNTLHLVTIYDKKQPRISRTINAETCKIQFSEDMTKLVFHLQNGEIHQAENDKTTNYRLIKFTDYTLYSNASGFGFERSEEGDLGRGDREMRIEDMQKLVDEANVQTAHHTARLDVLLEEHLNYLLGVFSNSEDANSRNSRDNAMEDEARMILRNEITSREQLATNETFISPRQRNIGSVSDRNSYDRNISQFIFSLQNIDASIKNSRERANRYEVEIHKKYAMSFACIVFILIGCPLGIITRGGNLGISGAITLIFYIIYWACLITGEKLADRLVIDPFISMWFGNIVLGIIGIILTVKANNESLAFSDMKIIRILKNLPHRKKNYISN